jgi:hypothetical protein
MLPSGISATSRTRCPPASRGGSTFACQKYDRRNLVTASAACSASVSARNLLCGSPVNCSAAVGNGALYGCTDTPSLRSSTEVNRMVLRPALESDSRIPFAARLASASWMYSIITWVDIKVFSGSMLFARPYAGKTLGELQTARFTNALSNSALLASTASTPAVVVASWRSNNADRVATSAADVCALSASTPAASALVIDPVAEILAESAVVLAVLESSSALWAFTSACPAVAERDTITFSERLSFLWPYAYPKNSQVTAMKKNTIPIAPNLCSLSLSFVQWASASNSASSKKNTMAPSSKPLWISLTSSKEFQNGIQAVKFIGIAAVLYGAFIVRLLRFRKKWSKV